MECDSVRIGLNGTRLTILGLKANFTIVKSRKLAIPDLPYKYQPANTAADHVGC